MKSSTQISLGIIQELHRRNSHIENINHWKVEHLPVNIMGMNTEYGIRIRNIETAVSVRISDNILLYMINSGEIVCNNIDINENNKISVKYRSELPKQLETGENDIIIGQGLINKAHGSDIIQKGIGRLFKVVSLNSLKFTRILSGTLETKIKKYELLGMRASIIADRTASITSYDNMNIEIISEKNMLVDNTESVFSNLHIKNLDLRELDFSKTTNMRGMFRSVVIDNLDIRGIDTSNAVNMSEMFNNATIKNIDLSQINTSKVKNMESMFEYCRIGDMKSPDKNVLLDISSFDTSNVTNMAYMLHGVRYNTIELGNIDTSDVISMKGMFSHSRLDNLDLSKLNTGNVLDFSEFLKEVTIPDIDISNIRISRYADISEFINSMNETDINLKIDKELFEDKDAVKLLSNIKGIKLISN